MQKLRRVEIKEGEIRLVRHFKYEGTVVAAGGGRMRLVGPSGFDGGLRLPVVLTSPPPPPPPPSPLLSTATPPPSGKRESCTNTVEGRRRASEGEEGGGE